MEKSLLVLLSAFINNLQTEYLFLDHDEKILYIKDILSNRSLKQSMEYIDAKVILSTVHGAKGLEWDHVIVRGMKNYSFPSFTLCGKVTNMLMEQFLYRSIVDQNNRSIFRRTVYLWPTEQEKFMHTTNNERINNSGISHNSQQCF
ncbi:MAG: 3'-5' exonuclease [Candidatus Borkfalkia sp.]